MKAKKIGKDLAGSNAATSINLTDWEGFLNNIEYLLELVLDYGEHNATDPQPLDDLGWRCRMDAFSDYRAGFEIRTWTAAIIGAILLSLVSSLLHWLTGTRKQDEERR